MSMHKVSAAEIGALLVDRLDRAVDDYDQDLFDAGILDSLAFVDLLVELETVYGVQIAFDDLDFDQFSTVERIAAFVNDSMLARAG